MGNIKYFAPILLLTLMLFASQRTDAVKNDIVIGVNGTSRLVEIEQNNSSIIPGIFIKPFMQVSKAPCPGNIM